MALKISGKQCKTGAGTSSGYRKGETGYPDFDVNSPYFGAASSSSTPAWDFTSSHHRPGANSRGDSRFTRVLAAGDQTPSADDVLLDDDPNKEWMAQVEPGVHITFVSLPNGGNDLKRIRFSREMFNKWQAQRWWGENYDRIMELYNVQRFNRQSLNTPPRSEDEVQRDSTYSRLGSARESPMIPSYTPRNYYRPSGMEANSYEASRTTSSSRDERPSVCASTASHMESEWVEQDEPGVYITIRQLNDGTRELRRVRFRLVHLIVSCFDN